VSTEPLKFEADFTLPAQIQVRAEHPLCAERTFAMHHERAWSYRQFRDESARVAHFLRARLGSIDDQHPAHVAMLLENHLELLGLYGGCGGAGATLFGINTGLRGDTLVGVLEQSRARLLVVDERLLGEVDKVRDRLGNIAAENTPGAAYPGGRHRAGQRLPAMSRLRGGLIGGGPRLSRRRRER